MVRMMYPPLFILRHGQTVWNAEHRVQGRLDSPLTPLGREHAEMQNAILRGENVEGFSAYSSPQGRAFHTASNALTGIVSEIETDVRLKEIGVGEWEGLYRKDLSNDLPVDESEESALQLYNRAPGGEGFSALRDRCENFLAELSKPAILVTHGVTSRMLRLVLLNKKTSEIGQLPGGQGVVFHIDNGIQTKLTLRA
ncbi:MAG: histidine phosphatase family protein [Roseobacter sp.]